MVRILYDIYFVVMLRIYDHEGFFPIPVEPAKFGT